MAEEAVVGLDIGTGGVRAVAVDAGGDVLATAEEGLPSVLSPREGWREQNPEDWWQGAVACLTSLRQQTRARIVGVCVDSTSGTIVPISGSGRPVRNAVMYNDGRATAEADEMQSLATELAMRMGYAFKASFGLPKILWLLRNEAGPCAGARFVNAADFITGRLTGDYGCTDATNALKMGYDLLDDRWPDWLSDLGLTVDQLPKVHRTGARVGCLSAEAAAATGIDAGAAVAAGPTDGVAAFYASGAVEPGQAATTLGTTLVIKAVSGRILRDPEGRVYCHKHADGHWLPGGASNCGCGYAMAHFPGQDPAALGEAAAAYLPCSVLLYPLPGRGERFPFVDARAERLASCQPSCPEEHFAAYLQGTAFVERWAYEVIESLGGDVSGTVFSSGGGSRSDLWMQLRADIMGREVARSANPDSAFGSAVLAASCSLFANLRDAVAAMVREEKRFAPRDAFHRRYSILYQRFREMCAGEGR